jgi:hypothetical protein
VRCTPPRCLSKTLVDNSTIAADMLNFMPATFADCASAGKLIKTDPLLIYTMRSGLEFLR